MRPWQKADWLPDLEIVRWPLLEDLRKAHRGAIEKAMDLAESHPGDKLAKDKGLAGVIVAAYTAIGELTSHWSDSEVAIAAVIREIEGAPPPDAPVGATIAEVQANEERAVLDDREHRFATAGQRTAVSRDVEALTQFFNGPMHADTLDGVRIVPWTVIELERCSDDLGRRAALRKSLAGATP